MVVNDNGISFSLTLEQQKHTCREQIRKQTRLRTINCCEEKNTYCKGLFVLSVNIICGYTLKVTTARLNLPAKSVIDNKRVNSTGVYASLSAEIKTHYRYLGYISRCCHYPVR